MMEAQIHARYRLRQCATRWHNLLYHAYRSPRFLIKVTGHRSSVQKLQLPNKPEEARLGSGDISRRHDLQQQLVEARVEQLR